MNMGTANSLSSLISRHKSTNVRSDDPWKILKNQEYVDRPLSDLLQPESYLAYIARKRETPAVSIRRAKTKFSSLGAKVSTSIAKRNPAPRTVDMFPSFLIYLDIPTICNALSLLLHHLALQVQYLMLLEEKQ